MRPVDSTEKAAQHDHYQTRPSGGGKRGLLRRLLNAALASGSGS